MSLLGAASMLALAAEPQRFPGADEVFTLADGVGEHPPVDDPETHRLLEEEPREPPKASPPEPLPTVAQAREAALKERARLKEVRSQQAAERKELRARHLMRREAILQRTMEQLQQERAEVALARPVNVAALADLDARLSYLYREYGRTRRELHELERVKRDLKQTRVAIQDTKNFRILPLVGPAYTPELGFSFAGGIQMSWTTDRRDRALPRSSAPVSVAYSTTGAVVFNTRVTTFWLHDKIRWNTEVWLKDMADNYWGVGYDAAQSPSKPDETTAYERFWWQVRPTLLGRVYKDLFVGGVFDFNQTIVEDPSEEIQADPDFVAFGPDNYNGGVGAIIAWDSRDFPVNAYRGIYAAATVTAYGIHLGGDNLYQVLELDYRHYLTIGRPGSTLAWQIHSRSAFGDVPYAEKSLLGSPFDLRGYRWGRYRDDSALYGLIEYRFMFLRRRVREGENPISRHGFVAWVGAGSVAPDITKMTHWLPNAGVGYRLEVQPRLNVRVDFGVGNDSQAFYFNFQESF